MRLFAIESRLKEERGARTRPCRVGTYAGAGMVRAIHDTFDVLHKHATTGLLNIGYRSGHASRIEQSLLAEGSIVLRTWAPVSPQLLTFARLGAFVVVLGNPRRR